MKKLLLLGLALSIGYCASAQKKHYVPAKLLNQKEKMVKNITGQELPLILNDVNPYVTSKAPLSLGKVIGTTYYDLQGNANIGNRILVYPDGKITAVWTMSQDGAGGFADRGTGYNHSSDGGATWLDEPTARIEGVKTGWPNIGNIDNDVEINVAHNGGGITVSKHSLTTNPTTWTPYSFTTNGITWPRMYVNGNTIHVIGTSDTSTPLAGFEKGALVYTRSTDGGENWSTPILPTGIDTTNYPPAMNSVNGTFSDEYSIAGRGNTIVIAVGDQFVVPAIIKSTDNGLNWTYTQIFDQPRKNFLSNGGLIYDVNGDGLQDNCYGADGAIFVTLDNNNKAHVFFGMIKFTSDGSDGSWYPYASDGIYYWNEDMGTIPFVGRWRLNSSSELEYEVMPDTVSFPIITEIFDINGNDTIDFPDNSGGVTSNQYPFGLYYTSLTGQPNAVIAPDGGITLLYSSIVEGTDILTGGTDHFACRNIWMIKKAAGSSTWSTPVRPNAYNFNEQVWPCVAPVLTTNGYELIAHYIYQGDDFPGTYLKNNPPHPVDLNNIYYNNLIVNVGIKENDVVKNAPVVYPNPATNYVSVSYNLTNAANVTLSIYNTVGQQIMTTTKNVNAGDTQVTLNIESLTHGVYFVKSDINGKTYTNKLVVK